jgi:glycosyltransferase involved in cell wall biosynthesis
MQVVYNWVDDRFFRLRGTREVSRGNQEIRSGLVGCLVGNCSSIKRHELALAAMAEVGHLVLHIGSEANIDVSETNVLNRLTEDERIVFRGIGAPEDWLEKADYFLLPSRTEGMSVALAEAIVAGLPCVVADVPGLQWARKVPGVTMVEANEEVWISAIRSTPFETLKTRIEDLDLSARRGAAEYAAIYASLRK